MLPALAYGFKQCSIVWKRDPQHAFIGGGKVIVDGELRNDHAGWQPAIDAWTRGETLTTCIGYDAGPRDSCRSYKAEGKATDGYANRFPLIEWGWDRERCVREIEAAGLPVPMKSACFHCPASKRSEVEWLQAFHPDLAAIAVEMELQAKEHGLERAGLGISWNWGDYIKSLSKTGLAGH